MEIPEEDRLAVKETCTDMDPFYVNVLKWSSPMLILLLTVIMSLPVEASIWMT